MTISERTEARLPEVPPCGMAGPAGRPQRAMHKQLADPLSMCDSFKTPVGPGKSMPMWGYGAQNEGELWVSKQRSRPEEDHGR